MRDVTLGNGTVMTDADFIKQRGQGDEPTDFMATKDDLVSLADKIADELLVEEFECELCHSLNDLNAEAYILFRLYRVADFLPEDEVDRICEKLRLGREKNRQDLADLMKGPDIEATVTGQAQLNVEAVADKQ